MNLRAQFEWDGDLKPVSTSFIGVSPEFEMAIYTLAYLMETEEVPCDLGPYSVVIKSFSIGKGAGAKLGTSFPEQVAVGSLTATLGAHLYCRRINV